MGSGTPLALQKSKPYRIHLMSHQCPGDSLVLTAAVESLHKQYPGEYLVSADTTCPEIWANNPGVRNDLSPHGAAILPMMYPAVHESDARHVHFMGGYTEDLARRIGRELPLRVNRPHLYLSDDERENPLPAVKDIGPYCVLNSGHKEDFTAKWAGTGIWQQVVDHFKGRLTFVQVGEKSPYHHHKQLDGTLYLVGKTEKYRDFFRLVQHAVCGAGPVSFLLHTCAALQRPYVALAGGRESQGWESYSSTIYLHTLGMLDCCASKACWKSRTVPLHDGNSNDTSLCKLPVLQTNGETIPRCLEMIGHQGVIEALERILRGRGL